MPIISSWIDEAGEGETDDFADLWDRIRREVASASSLIFYAEPDDFPLKGALVEVGIAFGEGVPIYVVLPGVVLEGHTARPVGSWVLANGVTRINSLEAAFGVAALHVPQPTGAGSGKFLLDMPKPSASDLLHRLFEDHQRREAQCLEKQAQAYIDAGANLDRLCIIEKDGVRRVGMKSKVGL